MLFSGSRGAPYTCLRCQLRQAIFPSRRRCIDRARIESARSFSARPSHRSQEDEATVQAPRHQNDRPYVYHYPLGRIVGGPGRRQRQGTQKLKIDAMKKPFEVIVMQDVREPEKKQAAPVRRSSEQSITAAQIESEMQREGQEVTQEEVNEAIRALRPDTTLLEEEQYKELAQSLTNGFTTEQLHGFLTSSLNLSAIEGDTVHLLREKPSELQTRYRRTQWRPGRTRIEKRLPMGSVIKKSERSNKPKVVEQILRLLWNLSIHAEEQRVGELEMKLESWELAYLFDLPKSRTEKGLGSMYENLVDSPFLLRVCNIRPHRSHGYLRISGRRQDAEEVAQRLEGQLPSIDKLSVKLSPFSPLLGSPGWPTTLDKLFRSDEISYIQERTLTIIEQPKHDVIHIYGNKEGWRMEARRHLFGLLDLPTPGSTGTLRNVTVDIEKAVALPEAAEEALDFRHRKLDLTRLAMPVKKKADSDQSSHQQGNSMDSTSEFISSFNAQVTSALANTALISLPKHSRRPSSYWHPKGFQLPWKVHFYRALSASDDASAVPTRGKKKRADKAPVSNSFTLNHRQTHRLEALLSFFAPRKDDNELTKNKTADPTLVARFIPSPVARNAKEMMKLPPIELFCSITRGPGGTSDVRLRDAQALVHKQVLRVPLPSEVTDLQFECSGRMRANVPTLLQQKGVEEFIKTLRTSARIKGPLVGISEVQFQLPAAMFREKNDAGDTEEPDVHAPYLFIGFEQRQTMEFQPLSAEKLPPKMDPELKDVLASFGDMLYLQVDEVTAGNMGERRMEVSLHQRGAYLAQRKKALLGQEEATSAESEARSNASAGNLAELDRVEQELLEQRVKCALGVARVLTRLSSGELHAMVHTQRPDKNGQAGDKNEEEDEESADARGQ